MNRNMIKKGDRIRLKTRLLGGWKGLGWATMDQTTNSPDAIIYFVKAGDDPDYSLHSRNCALRSEVAKIQKSWAVS